MFTPVASIEFLESIAIFVIALVCGLYTSNKTKSYGESFNDMLFEKLSLAVGFFKATLRNRKTPSLKPDTIVAPSGSTY